MKCRWVVTLNDVGTRGITNGDFSRGGGGDSVGVCFGDAIVTAFRCFERKIDMGWGGEEEFEGEVEGVKDVPCVKNVEEGYSK